MISFKKENNDSYHYKKDKDNKDILTDGRLILGVARGAFAWEMARLGSPIEYSKEKFNEKTF